MYLDGNALTGEQSVLAVDSNLNRWSLEHFTHLYTLAYPLAVSEHGVTAACGTAGMVPPSDAL